MFYDPSFDKARFLYADVLEQLGYQEECGTLRNSYLNGAKELREGARKIIPNKDRVNDSDFLKIAENMNDDLMLDYIGLALDGERAQDAQLAFRLDIKDNNDVRSYIVQLINGTLLHGKTDNADREECTVSEDLPRIQTPPGILVKLVQKDIRSVQDHVITDHFEILEELENYLDDPMDSLDYTILEKRK